MGIGIDKAEWAYKIMLKVAGIEEIHRFSLTKEEASAFEYLFLEKIAEGDWEGIISALEDGRFLAEEAPDMTQDTCESLWAFSKFKSKQTR